MTGELRLDAIVIADRHRRDLGDIKAPLRRSGCEAAALRFRFFGSLEQTGCAIQRVDDRDVARRSVRHEREMVKTFHHLRGLGRQQQKRLAIATKPLAKARKVKNLAEAAGRLSQ